MKPLAESPDEGIMYPASVLIGMLNMQPAALAFDDFKWNSFFNGKQDFIVGSRSGADIAKILFGDDRRDAANQAFVNPSSVILKILKIIP